MEYISRSPKQTRRIGMRVGALMQAGDLVCLAGTLGSGKTTFIQGVASGWGSLDPATSPSFVLVNVYRRFTRDNQSREQRLYHLDAYRLNNASEAEELDLEAMLDTAPLVVEWADRIQSCLPVERLWVQMRWIDTEQRDMVFSAAGRRYQEMLGAIRRLIFGVT